MCGDATIEKFVGDAIMISFGAPTATTDRDQALRTVRMAIQMQERLVTMRRQWLPEGAGRTCKLGLGLGAAIWQNIRP